MQNIKQALAAFVRKAHLQQFDGGQDWRQDVVQIVRNTAGQRANTLHSLRAQELRFHPLVFSHVANDDSVKLLAFGIDLRDGSFYRKLLAVSAQP